MAKRCRAAPSCLQSAPAGIAILWNKELVDVVTHAVGQFAVTIRVTVARCHTSFWLTTVYGPNDDASKEAFLAEISSTAPPMSEPWIICSDFNQIYEAREKNNLNLNRRLMDRFRTAIDRAGLRQLKCSNRKYIWSNERDNPILVGIDKFFCNVPWETLFPLTMLMAASTACSDHCPLVLSDAAGPRRRRCFKFESFWPRFPCFADTVTAAWARPVAASCAFTRLHVKLARTAKDLRIWSQGLFGDARPQFHMACEVILRLDEGQERRQLSPAERDLRRSLKLRLLGLAAIERCRKRQASRLTWLRSGDAPTKFFMAKICSRKRNNFIHSLKVYDTVATAHSDKEAAIHNHFDSILGATQQRSSTINWGQLHMPTIQGGGLDNPFSEEEVWAAIQASPAEKSPGPDGFNGTFFRSFWQIIKEDVMQAFNQFYNLASSNFGLLNSAIVALIPKKDGANGINDYRPISLIHSIAKLVSKVLSIRLAPIVQRIISPAQTAFLKTRCLHDSFVYVQNCVKALHRKKTSAVLLKLDISRAFDNVSWEYLLELLVNLGFSARWRDWITMLLATSSSAFLNGVPGQTIMHRRGLRQGDPLSPLLFILAIDPIHRLLKAAEEELHITLMPGREIKFRVSLYANDAIIFANPSREEIDYLMDMLESFGDATGLKINNAKSTATPTCCHDIDLSTVLQSFGGPIAQFPIRYLGLPLTTGRLRLVHLQFILDRMRARLAGWKGKMLSMAGRRVLVRCVLTAMPTFALTALKIPVKLLKEIDKCRRRFLWGHDQELVGGSCKVDWARVCSPIEHGGLGILDLYKFSCALRLRWLWHAWKSPERPWAGTELPCDASDHALFSVPIGNGKMASFWHSAWIDASPLKLLHPNLFKHSRRKNRSVAQALLEDRWVSDLAHGDTGSIAQEVLNLHRRLQSYHLQEASQDQIAWKIEASGQYTAHSAYRAQFQGSVQTQFRELIWTTRAPAKLKIFAWLLHQNRLWCNDRLQRRGWPNSYFCPLCLRNLESSEHLF